ncbi:GAF domain protein (macronuclear) [Tetrahymena thermophila SB210]|uniref:GAF domain protein n=1 Tax=Tetrahymena thermophila (strain SB210) TaxID=312017 RepID=Q24GJ8_TETTS|nr:GAF domain protein [Tetrahymena thermophila SB210]EAS06873.1 GAF domain protein [Tetrahymena thermophila SB210]|eukprot:XP_001027115.1 GAF domain protein [Tetrahymena thermophila SB210]
MKRKYNSTQKIVVNNKIEDLYTELINSAVFFPQISKKEQDKIQPEMFHSNLPNISDIINSKKKVIPDNVKSTLINLTDYARQLENLLRLKNKEIERLSFLNNFLSISAQKKDELLEAERKELNRVKDELSQLEAQFKDRVPNKKDVKSQKNTIIIQQKDYGVGTPRLQAKESNSLENFQKAVQSKLQNDIVQTNEEQQQNTNIQQQNLKQKSNNKIPQQAPIIQTIAAPTQPPQQQNIPTQAINNQNLQVYNPNHARKQNRSSINELSATSFLPMNSYLAGDNQTDTLKTPTIINLNLNDDDAIEAYSTNENISYLHKLVKDEAKFIEYIAKAPKLTLGVIYERIRKALQDSKVYFLLLIRLKKIIRASFEMTKSLVLNDALETIVDETCICLECDRCTVYVVDEKKNELWSKMAKGTKNVIRMPINQGIAGFVATTKQTLNILNAYADERFNKDFDKKMNYKSRTILCVPIIDEHGRVLGAIQCINKLNGHFTKDDEALLMVIADFSRIVLKNAINYDEQNLAHSKLRSIVNLGIYQNSQKDLKSIIYSSESKLKDIMHIDDARIILNNMDGTMWYINEENQQITLKIDQGIAGLVFKQKETVNCFNCYHHKQFSPEVDIITQMPTLCIPVTHPKSKEALAVLEVVNVKGISSMYESAHPKIQHLDQEVLHYFVKQLASVLISRLEWFEGYEFEKGQNEDILDDPKSSYNLKYEQDHVEDENKEDEDKNQVNEEGNGEQDLKN